MDARTRVRGRSTWQLVLYTAQVQIIPVSPKFTDYARSVQRRVRAAGFYVDCDLSARTLNKMVRRHVAR